MDRVRRISTELLTRYRNKFAQDFEHNKQALNEVATIRSKVLRNTIAGYITSYVRKSSTYEEAPPEPVETEDSEPSRHVIDEKRMNR